jgi:molecular chaperone DnaJ
VPITFAEAVTGAELSIPGIDERPIRLHVPPGIRSGDSVRVPGAGVPASSGAGDLIATVVIDVPTTLTDAQRAALDALAGQLPNPRAGGKEES